MHMPVRGTVVHTGDGDNWLGCDIPTSSLLIRIARYSFVGYTRGGYKRFHTWDSLQSQLDRSGIEYDTVERHMSSLVPMGGIGPDMWVGRNVQ